ncbi:hypothetical protein DAEQUDRAFT_773916 [Daedalea quercina L-15889]|uniref:BTB domain-containing protein n=1 Tax=Daedalea quercina L-15889 TaxID=1314783 RepID=A0A165LBZ8_9APHY|nr:hypothetical protein DAEQUDRAFT_773916 [Daedalea quercina L-15889]
MSVSHHLNATSEQTRCPSTSQPVKTHRSRFFLEPETVYLRLGGSSGIHQAQVTDGDKNEEHLFKVHRYFLERDSELFRGMFACPPTQPGANTEGQAEETAIHLPCVTPFELECLMSFLYEGMYDRIVSLEEWVALLSVASRLLFDKIRERAISVIETHIPALEPAEKIVLAAKHDIPQWLAPSFTELCTRSDPLTEDESSKLGAETAKQVTRARDLVKLRVGYGQPGGVGFSMSFAGCGCKDCRQARSESARASYMVMVDSIIKETIALP